MSQASQTIAAASAESKAETSMAAAMSDARARKAGKAASPAPAAKASAAPVQPTRAAAPARKPVTIETVRRLAPHTGLAETLGRTFGLDVPDCEAIADAAEEAVGRLALTLKDAVPERALKLHLDRIVGAHVASAHGAAQFYSGRVTAARERTSKLANEARDEDRWGEHGRDTGFDDAGQRARLFAAQAGMQAYAILAAAEGALSAYAQVIGEEWKPWTPTQDASRSPARRSAAEELAAFG